MDVGCLRVYNRKIKVKFYKRIKRKCKKEEVKQRKEIDYNKVYCTSNQIRVFGKQKERPEVKPI